MKKISTALFICFIISSIAIAQKKKDKEKPADFKAFWKDFQALVKAQDKKKLDDHCEFEFYYIIRSKSVTVEDEKIEVSKGKFSKEYYEILFNTAARKEIAQLTEANIGNDMLDKDKRVAVITCQGKNKKPAKRRYFFAIDDKKYKLVMVDEEQI